MKRIVNISDANEIQVKQKLSKNAKVTAWLLAGAIASIGVESTVNYINTNDNSKKIEVDSNQADVNKTEEYQQVVDYFATTGGSFKPSEEIKVAYDDIGAEEFYNAQEEGINQYKESGRSK